MLTRLWKSAGSTRMMLGLFAVAVILMCLTSTGFAQSTASEGDNDAYYLGYYGGANMGLPAAEVNIVNPGSELSKLPEFKEGVNAAIVTTQLDLISKKDTAPHDLPEPPKK